MRRFIIGCSAAALLLVGGPRQFDGRSGDHPADGGAGGDHPVVGAWVLTVDEFPEDPPELVAFHADGTYQSSSADGTTGIGAWEATGPNSFNLTFIELDEEGPSGMVRAAGEVSEDGQSFTAEFTIGFTGEGAPAGEYGPGHVTAHAYQRRADGHAGRFPGRPLRPVRGGHRAGGHRTGGHRASGHRAGGHRHQRAPNQRAPNRLGPRRPILRWQPRRASRRVRIVGRRPFDGTRLAPQCWTRRMPSWVPGWGRGEPVPAATEDNRSVGSDCRPPWRGADSLHCFGVAVGQWIADQVVPDGPAEDEDGGEEHHERDQPQQHRRCLPPCLLSGVGVHWAPCTTLGGGSYLAHGSPHCSGPAPPMVRGRCPPEVPNSRAEWVRRPSGVATVMSRSEV